MVSSLGLKIGAQFHGGGPGNMTWQWANWTQQSPFPPSTILAEGIGMDNILPTVSSFEPASRPMLDIMLVTELSAATFAPEDKETVLATINPTAFHSERDKAGLRLVIEVPVMKTFSGTTQS